MYIDMWLELTGFIWKLLLLVSANGSLTDRWKTRILLKKLMLACKFNIAATLVTSVV